MANILVTGSTGMTGSYLLPALVAAGHDVVGVTRSGSGAAKLAGMPGVTAAVLSLHDQDALIELLTSFDACVHIGPAGQAQEAELGRSLVRAISALNGPRPFLLYFSVLHPQIESLLNHRAKLDVERAIIDSGVAFTILQYTHLSQDIDVIGAVESGEMQEFYSLAMPMSFVDLADVVAVAEIVLRDPPTFAYGTFELCGPDCLTAPQVADIISREAGEHITLKWAPPQISSDNHLNHSHDSLYTAEFWLRLANYYSQHGIRGNPTVLTALLGRAPRTVADYVRTELGVGGSTSIPIIEARPRPLGKRYDDLRH